MTKLTLLTRAAATAAAALGPCAIALALPAGASAAGKGLGEDAPLNLTPSSGSSSHAGTGGASLVRTIVGLLIVIAVIWGLSWILRQVKRGREPHVGNQGLSSVAALTLSSGRSVHLIRAGSEYVLLGSAEHGVVPIHRYSEQEARDAGLLVAEQQQQPRRRRALLAPRSGSREAAPAAQPRALLEPPVLEGEAPVYEDDPAELEARTPASRQAARPATVRVSSGAYGDGLLDRLREWTVRA